MHLEGKVWTDAVWRTGGYGLLFNPPRGDGRQGNWDYSLSLCMKQQKPFRLLIAMGLLCGPALERAVSVSQWLYVISPGKQDHLYEGCGMT